MKIYTAGSISGKTQEEVIDYFEKTKSFLESVGYQVFNPMTAKGYLRTDMKFRAQGYTSPVSTNRAIIGRDKWMVEQADIIYCNLATSKIASIGSVAEMAWGYHYNKHIISVIPKDNIHQHAFVLQMCDIVYDNEADALEYLTELARDFGLKVKQG